MLAFWIVLVVAPSVLTPLRGQAQREADSESTASPMPLFLHVLAGRSYDSNPPRPAHRIVTSRIYLFKDFFVSAGENTSPFAKPWDGAVTSPVWSNGVPKARPLESLWDSGDASLAGRIDQVGRSFLAHLQGRDRTTVSYFNGKIELEKPVYELGAYYHGGAIWPVWFVLSTNADSSGFLQGLDDGRIQRPDVVDRNDPLAKRWVESGSNAEPGSTANQSQPISPHTNQTPATAGSGR